MFNFFKKKIDKIDKIEEIVDNPRLGPLNVAQLEKLLTSSRKRHVAKITRRIAELKGRSGYRAPAVAEAVAE